MIDATVSSAEGGVIATGHDGIHGSLTGKTYVVAHTWGDITQPLTSAEGPVAAGRETAPWVVVSIGQDERMR